MSSARSASRRRRATCRDERGHVGAHGVRRHLEAERLWLDRIRVEWPSAIVAVMPSRRVTSAAVSRGATSAFQPCGASEVERRPASSAMLASRREAPAHPVAPTRETTSVVAFARASGRRARGGHAVVALGAQQGDGLARLNLDGGDGVDDLSRREGDAGDHHVEPTGVDDVVGVVRGEVDPSTVELSRKTLAQSPRRPRRRPPNDVGSVVSGAAAASTGGSAARRRAGGGGAACAARKSATSSALSFTRSRALSPFRVLSARFAPAFMSASITGPFAAAAATCRAVFPVRSHAASSGHRQPPTDKPHNPRPSSPRNGEPSCCPRHRGRRPRPRRRAPRRGRLPAQAARCRGSARARRAH